MRVKQTILGGCAVFALAAALTQQVAVAETLHLDPGTFGAVGKVDDRFQSYNIEMAEIIGARFWKPYVHMTKSDAPAGDFQAGVGPNLFEQRTPLDLSSRRLRVLAAALGPAYMRVSGSWANTVHFQDDDGPAVTEGYRGVLTRAQWRGVIEFAKVVDAKLVTSFGITPSMKEPSGVWTPVEAGPLLKYTHSIGGEIYAAELFNEPNLASGGLKGYDAARFARDVAAFRTFVAEAAPGLKVAGPGDIVTGGPPRPGAFTAEELVTAEPHPQFDIFTYHFYGAVSPRCAPPTSETGTSRDQALTEEWLARTDQAFQAHKDVRDRHLPGAPIWLNETAQAACGGSPWAATFVDTFRYLDQMGRLAKQGVSAIFHNTLDASEYGMIDMATLEPRPNYWGGLLWRRLMGNVVLDAGPIRPGLHVYAQCLRDHSGGVSVLAINTGDAPAALDVSAPAEVYALTAPTLDSGTVMLNGRKLVLGSDDRIPALKPRHLQDSHVTLASQSIDFIAIPKAKNSNCM